MPRQCPLSHTHSSLGACLAASSRWSTCNGRERIGEAPGGKAQKKNTGESQYMDIYIHMYKIPIHHQSNRAPGLVEINRTSFSRKAQPNAAPAKQRTSVRQMGCRLPRSVQNREGNMPKTSPKSSKMIQNYSTPLWTSFRQFPCPLNDPDIPRHTQIVQQDQTVDVWRCPFPDFCPPNIT